MTKEISNGTKKTIDGKPCVYYDGYWIRRYELKTDNLATKKQLIDQLTRRVFHHVEPGINTPGYRLEEIREIYEKESDPARKRVKGAMLAGALLNRGSDILTAIVELEEAGVNIEPGNQLLSKCGQCFMEALNLGKNIKLSVGCEGLDELWGEPFKVFYTPIDAFYESRYIKVAQTMSEIDYITDILIKISKRLPDAEMCEEIIRELGTSAKLACETLRSDPVIFDIWPRYVVAKENLEDSLSKYVNAHDFKYDDDMHKAIGLIKEGASLLMNLSTVRVPMPESTKQFLDKCSDFT